MYLFIVVVIISLSLFLCLVGENGGSGVFRDRSDVVLTGIKPIMWARMTLNLPVCLSLSSASITNYRRIPLYPVLYSTGDGT